MNLNIPLEKLEMLEKKYNIMIHVVTDVSTGENKYYYKHYAPEQWIYVTDDTNKLNDCLYEKLFGKKYG